MTTNKTEGFIDCARAVHGNSYDYSLVEYVNAKTKVDVVCPTHGVFSQTPDHHKRGKGCRQCGFEASAKRKAHSKEDFVTKATLVHGSKYTYDNVDYVNAKSKVWITCKLHGNFLQTPDSHTGRGHGCKICANESSRREPVPQGYNLNSPYYDCPKHGKIDLGVSLSEANRRLYDVCPKCNKEANLRARAMNFISRSVEAHGSRYDYSKVSYESAKHKVEIVCEDHGSFFQTPNSHTNGNGCKKCGLDRDYSAQVPAFAKLKAKYLEKNRGLMEIVPTSLYLLKLNDLDKQVYKIGVSRLPVNRYKRLMEVYGSIEVIYQADIDGYQAYLNEMGIHKALDEYRYIVPSKPEGHTELFQINDELLHTLIKQIKLVENLV